MKKTPFRLYRIITGLLYALALFSLPSHAAANPVVTGLDIYTSGAADRITLHISRSVTYSTFSLDNPSRLVVDIPYTDWRTVTGLPDSYRGKVLRNIRFGHFNTETSRLVFDLTEPAELREVAFREQGAGKPVLMTLEIALHGAVKSADTVPSNVPSSAPHHLPVPVHRPDWGSMVEDAQDTPPPITAGYFDVVPSPTFKPGTREPRKAVVVIDAGHGGRDPGATGTRSTREKDVTLSYARALADTLQRTGRYHVVLTRNDDHYIMLRERLAIGRQAKGDMFISIHADSAPNHNARGLSIYTLSDTASDKEAAALAARENKVDLIYGMNLSTEEQDVTEILIDLAQRETKNKSVRLADALLHELARQVQLRPNTHRYAGFAVLKAPDVPSVLLELGFLSNRHDEALINSTNYRSQVIQALAAGIERYFRTQKHW